ncbi:FAD-binding oxidoreductase [Anianabacter salinae]|uniref:FAD-binding oxidoreductase n=1 Tax=Anianabacter salinae TaxID=2851023 RepID=UPI00225E352A|nr:FAD-binding oxidoreductase [Anianabacter salinae]MBV0910851.1 FAD-binding oxidoreductase [Anianabacter salinae]
MDVIGRLTEALGEGHVLTGEDMARYARDWTGRYVSTPMAVTRPGSTLEVSAVLKIAHDTGTPVVPVSGNTGVAGGTKSDGAIMVSVERLRAVRAINPAARTATAEAGVILSKLHDAVAEHDLAFPVFFGARGSAMVGGILSTNAGGSNVLRYGNTRALVLGIEAVLPDGTVLDLMSELHKDNSGYDLRDLFIGAEGTLGIITAAVVKLVPAPRAHATAMVAVPSLADALALLNDLQAETGGGVEAFEYMPQSYFDALATVHPDLRAPFADRHEVNILIEVAATAARDAAETSEGTIPVVDLLEATLARRLEDGTVTDAVVARTGRDRQEMWARREAAAEVSVARKPNLTTDIAVPLDKVAAFLDQTYAALAALDAGVEHTLVSHLGDGNVHLTIWPSSEDEALRDRMNEAVEEVVLALNGSFSAEHGIGLSKLPSMRRRKNPVALAVMRRIKRAIDPKGIMNPGKVIPD